MPLIIKFIRVGPSTDPLHPAKEEVKIPPGVLTRVWVYIPPGQMGLAHLVIKHGQTQIIPWEGDISGDDEVLDFNEYIVFETETTLTLEAWNEDSWYTRFFVVRILILPQIIAAPLVILFRLFRKLLEVMGIE
jgi:hypothetical protein